MEPTRLQKNVAHGFVPHELLATFFAGAPKWLAFHEHPRHLVGGVYLSHALLILGALVM